MMASERKTNLQRCIGFGLPCVHWPDAAALSREALLWLPNAVYACETVRRDAVHWSDALQSKVKQEKLPAVRGAIRCLEVEA